MDELLKVMLVIFMVFMCCLCLFAVVVIVRDIVRESIASRRRDDDEEDGKRKPKHSDEPNEVQPAAQHPEVLPVSEPVVPVVIAPQPVVRPTPQPVAPVQSVQEPVVATVAEDDPDAVKFNRVKLTMEEKYGTLSAEFKRYFDDIVRHTLAKDGVKELKRESSYDYKIGSYRVLRIMIKRSDIVCEFSFIDNEFNNYATESNVRIKQAATTVRVSEASAVGVVKDGVDRVCRQIAEDKERKEQLAREKRKERRRLAKEQEENNK